MAIMGYVGNDHINIDLVIPQHSKDTARHSRFIGNSRDGNAGLGALDGDSTNDHSFHCFMFFSHNCSGVIIERRTNFKLYAIFLCEFD